MVTAEKMRTEYVYAAQLVFAISMFLSTTEINFDMKCLMRIAQFILYLMIIKQTENAVLFIHTMLKYPESRTWNLNRLAKKYKYSLLLFVVAVSILIYNGQKVLGPDLVYMIFAYLTTKYPEMEEKAATVTYGTGMACSFFEGYLVHVIPPDGSNFDGFLGNIRRFEAANNVVFPVRRLFLIVTKTLYCPSDLVELNKENRPDLPYLQSCRSLSAVQKDVAGVKQRSYSNSAYKLCREGRPPVYLVAEGATPLHTLYRVTRNTHLYAELARADVDEIREEFCSTLERIVNSSPECTGKCEIVYYDNTNKDLNLASLLLRRIAEIEPNFENLRPHN